MRRATSHTRLRILLAGVAVACLALPPRRVPAQPPRSLPPHSPLPRSRDGSHDFNFLEGTWQISEAPADYFTRGPFGRLVARIPAPRSVTIEWQTQEPGAAFDSGFVQMLYDPRSNRWMRRPVNPRRMSVVSFTWFADRASYRRHLEALETDAFWHESVLPNLTRFLVKRPATWRLVPVGRSRELRDWREAPQ